MEDKVLFMKDFFGNLFSNVKLCQIDDALKSINYCSCRNLCFHNFKFDNDLLFIIRFFSFTIYLIVLEFSCSILLFVIQGLPES